VRELPLHFVRDREDSFKKGGGKLFPTERRYQEGKRLSAVALQKKKDDR